MEASDRSESEPQLVFVLGCSPCSFGGSELVKEDKMGEYVEEEEHITF